MLRSWSAFVLMLVSVTAMAQVSDELSYYPYAELELRSEEPYSDSTLFYRAIGRAEELFTATTEFNLPRVTLKRRGESFRHEFHTWYELPISYRHTSLLRALGGEERQRGGATMGDYMLGSTGGISSWQLADALPLQPYEASARLTNRNYRVSGRVKMFREVGHWQLGAVVDARMGRDARLKGLSHDGLSVAVSGLRRWSKGSSLAFLASFVGSRRELRSATTEEAFTLLDDPYYNPSWGLQGGKERNARVRREWIPYVALRWQQPLTERTLLRLATGLTYGVSSQSALGWYNARTPLPDNYRYMPSYTGDRLTEEAWLKADARYTQIRWDELIAQNRMGDGDACYALEDRVSRPLTGDVALMFESRLDGLLLRYGLRGTYHRTRHYKEMNDLLGASFLTDIDQYLIDDDSYANQLENNLQNPSRRITEGERFGYDYALVRGEGAAFMEARWQRERLTVKVGGEIGTATIYRRGYYEKELFAGAASLGRSRTIRLNPYRLKGSVGYAFSPRSYLELTLAAGAETPLEAHLFLQPQYNNRSIASPTEENFYAVQGTYRRRHERFDVELTAFLTTRLDGVESTRYFDDLSGEYADLVMAELGTMSYGVEGAWQWRPAYRWTVALAASWGSYRYMRDAQVSIFADTDNRPIEERAVSHLRDCRIGGAPTVTAAASVRYYGPRGWGFRLSGGYAGGRYVDAAPLRRTDRVARQNGTTPEAFEAFTRQERLEDAMTLDAGIFKSIYVGSHTLFVSVQATNLLGREQRSYGYESLRSMRVGEDTAALRMPQPSRYLYALPRTLSLGVSWRF